MRLPVSNSSIKLCLYFVSSQKLQILGLILLCILCGSIPTIDSILLRNITNLIEATGDIEVQDLPKLMLFWAILYGLWWETINLFFRAYDYLYLKTMPIIKGNVLDKFYDHTQYHQYSFFQTNLAGHITSRITEASRSLEMVIAIFSEQVVRKFAIIIFSLIAMYSVHYKLALIFFIWLCFFIGVSIFFSRTANHYSKNYSKQKAKVTGKIVDSITNVSAIRMFNAQKFEHRYLRSYIDKAVIADEKMQLFMLRLRYFMGLSCSIMIFVMIYFIASLRSQLLVTIGDCVLILSLCLAVTNDLWDLMEEIGDIFEELGAFQQSISLIQPHAISDVENPAILQVTKGRIEFQNVTFYYGDNKIFSNKSIIIPEKQKIGLVGFSGAGKSSFVNLIVRLYDIKEGSILIDEQDIRNVSQDSLRNNISVIPQEPILFHRTIIENIRYSKREATEEEVIAAAKAAHIHDFIMQLPKTYNSLCGERGNNLSGGQKQRIIIARAILKNAPILILDEATSSLDSATENAIQESLDYLMRDKTVIVIAHRLSTLLNMNKILVFDQGMIVEEGTHKELLKNGKLYQHLWQSQISGLIP